MVLLNGKYVAPSEIDPAKHRFIGTFRPAKNPFANAACNVMCNCGTTLQTDNAVLKHYKDGCFDLNQYVDINP